jgi:hypothetical protein
MVVAAEEVLVSVAELGDRRAAELAAPDDERLVDLARRGVPDAGGEVARIARNHKAAAPDGAQLSPEGKPLGMIRFPERPSNCALGGKDGRTLFVTAQKGVCSIDVEGARSR